VLQAETFAAIRRAPHLQGFLAELRAEAERARATAPEGLPFRVFRRFADDGDRRAFERRYFDRRRRLVGLVLTSVLDETDAYLAALHDLLWEVCNEYTWAVPAHLGREARPPEETIDLFAAETAHALAETLLLLGPRLEPRVAARVRSELERRVFRPLEDPTPYRWESLPTNWAAVCAGGVGMAALALEGDPARRAALLTRLLRAMAVFLEGYGDDGGCPEGIGYWVYGFGYYVYFAEALRAYTGGALDLLEGEKVRAIAAFPAGVSLSGGAFANFSDASERPRLHTGLLSRLEARLGTPLPEVGEVPSFHADACYRWGHLTRTLFWTDPALFHRPAPAGTRVFPNLAWVVDRHSCGDATVAFAAKGGHNGEPHNHNDVGHFILHAGGENLLVDLGAGLYTRDYFGEARYEALHTASEGHSVPLVGGRPQRAGRAHAAEVRGLETKGTSLRFDLELTDAYDLPGLERLERRFLWRREEGGARLELLDTASFRDPDTLEEVFVSLHPPTVERGAVCWRGARGEVRLDFDPALFEPVAETLPSRAHHGEPLVVQRLRLTLRAPARRVTGRFLFTVTPLGGPG